MADVFGISISALQAFQTAISVTSNNIANANTPGYAQESVDLTAAAPLSNGSVSIGAGVVVSGVSRAYSQLAANQLTTSQSSLGQLDALQTYTNQIDNIVGTTAGGLTTALQNYYNAWSTLANNPASSSARQALLSQAQAIASAFQGTNAQLQNLDNGINTGITTDVKQINSIATSIATLNQKIVLDTAESGGQPPLSLIDQRDNLVSNLSKLTGISTTTDTNGALNVFVANGVPLVLQGTTTALTTVANPFNASQLEIAAANNTGNIISRQITSGDLGGLLAARSQAVNPAINQLGQIAVALNTTANAQQGAGLDLTGKFGANLFSIGTPQATASSGNTGGVAAAVSINNLGALTAKDYLLTYRGGAYSLVNAADGSSVAFTSTGTPANPSFSADGLQITLSGTPASGDQFLIRPTATAAGSFAVALSSSAQLAAAGALTTIASSTNTGNATIGAATVQNAANPNVLQTATIQFTSPTTYSINGAGSNTYTPGGPIGLNGWQVAIGGTPAAGDVFTVQKSSSGDNRNALAIAASQTQGVLSSGTQSINGGLGALVTGIGSQAQQVTTAQTAQAAVNSQAQQTVASISGVNLNEEAAALLQWQQAYEASAKALQIGSGLFQTLLTAVQSA